MSPPETAPLVSVLMAAYNAARYIDQAIASLVAQTFSNWELVAVDDGSTDSTTRQLQAWAARDQRIRFFRNDRNLGIGPTRQRTLDLARSAYAAVLDADDIALPEWLATRLRYLDGHPDVVVASGPRIVMDEHGKRPRALRESASREVLRWRLIFGNPVNDPSSVFRAAEARAVGGYPSVLYLADWSLFSRLAEAGRIAQTGPPLIKYRVHDANSSSTTGARRQILEPVAAGIISRNLKATLNLDVPSDLAWYLFRGRYVFAGSPAASRRALALVLQAYAEFAARGLDGSRRGPVAAAALADATNVLRCGGWTPRAAASALAHVVAGSGGRVLLSRSGIANAVKVLLTPVFPTATRSVPWPRGGGVGDLPKS